MLTPEQLKAREGKITGSQMNIIMSGNQDRILNLWRELVGDPRYEPEDLSKVWPIRLGEATEALNLAWYELKYNHTLIRKGMVVVDGWKAVTLDAWDAKDDIPVEAKCVNSRVSMDDVIARYAPQTHWQMIVTGAKKCALSVIIGGAEPIVEIIPYNADYADSLVARARVFLDHVENLIPPCEIPKIEPPPLPVKEYDMSHSLEWESAASGWVQSYGAAQIAKEQEQKLKSLVPEDARKCWGHGVIVTRNRAGSMSLRELRT
jgi:hypothetical protein